jgi:hypothetical protein
MNNQKGQGVVEYILLLTVAISLVLTFYRSEAFQRLFGTQGQLGQSVKRQSEFGYRHAYMDPQAVNEPTTNSVQNHPSYFNGNAGETRFFGPSDPYP